MSPDTFAKLKISQKCVCGQGSAPNPMHWRSSQRSRNLLAGFGCRFAVADENGKGGKGKGRERTDRERRGGKGRGREEKGREGTKGEGRKGEERGWQGQRP